MDSIEKLVIALGKNVADFEDDMKRSAVISKRELKRMEQQAKELNKKWAQMFESAADEIAAIESGIRKR